jgi:hypothetical protein
MIKLSMLALAVAVATPAVAQDMPAAQPSPAAPVSPDPKGGYAPPPMPPVPAGATVQFQPSVSPDVAFPPPAPLASYPICKRGQQDHCRQRNDPK